MVKVFAYCVLFTATTLSSLAGAEPIDLKYAFFASDRSTTYRDSVKPFIDAVNADPSKLLKIELYPSGVLGKEIARQPQLVLDGTSDFATVVAGTVTERFPDTIAIALPGLFRDSRETTFVHTRLVASGALRGYEDFFTVGAISGAPMPIHTRTPVASLEDLKGKKIRVNNSIEATALKALGMVPVVLPIIQAAELIGAGTIDGTTAQPNSLGEFGISRIATYHYLLSIGSAPAMMLMNKKKFDSLPEAAQNLIRKYSGEWLAARHVEAYDAQEVASLDQLKSDPKRHIILPSDADRATAQIAFKSVVDEWAASPRNSELLVSIKRELATLRSGRK